MDYLEKCFEKDPNIPTRVIDKEVILVPIRRKLADVSAIYLLRDDVSARTWELIDGKRKVQDIKEIICKEFDVPPEKAENDLTEFFKQLEKIGGIIREVCEKS